MFTPTRLTALTTFAALTAALLAAPAVAQETPAEAAAQEAPAEAPAQEAPAEAAAQEAPAEHADVHIPKHGVAIMIPTKGNDVHGIVMFEQLEKGVRVRGKINNLSPGEHGFHIHQFGDLSKADGTSAGGHFNPEGTDHGGPDAEKHHAGDLGNITAGEDGVASFEHTFKFLKLHHIIGRSVVVHGGADDLESQPSGDAGPRVAVGVIGIAHMPEKEEK